MSDIMRLITERDRVEKEYKNMFPSNNSYKPIKYEMQENPFPELINNKIQELSTLIDEDTLASSLYCPTTHDRKIIRESKDDAHQYCESRINYQKEIWNKYNIQYLQDSPYITSDIEIYGFEHSGSV